MNTLERLFAPGAVAIVGASRDATKLGGAMAASLEGADRPVLLVNPRADDMYPTLAAAAAATPVDLVVSCVPAAATADVVREAGAVGAGAVLVCAAGFAEAGGDGSAHQAALLAAVRETGIRLVGPNTSGFVVPGVDLLASFVPSVRRLRAGSVAVVAASGGINHALAFALQRSDVGLSLGIGVGAALDVDLPDVLDHLVTDDRTASVILHVETVHDGPRLLDAVRRITAVKPVVALVVGQHDVGDFARSHTGALATSWRTTRSLLAHAGAVVVDDEAALVAAATALAGTRLDPSADPGVVLVTAQAGPGLLMADTLQGAGVALPTLSPQTQQRLAALLPPMTYQANPVDTGRPGPHHHEVLAAVAADPAVDLVAVYGLTEPVVDLPGSVAAADLRGVPVLVGLDGPDDEVAEGRRAAAKEGVPLVVGATPLADAVAALVADARARHLAADAVTPRGQVPAAGDGPWDEAQAKDLLDALGLATPPRRVCRDRDEAHRALDELGGPVAVKVCDASVLHKTDVGGVHLGVTDHARLDTALDALPGPVLVESMAADGTDLIVAARRDPVFGPVVVLGIGGTATEVYADVAIAAHPVGPRRVAAMAAGLHGRALLDGHRGAPRVDIEALAEVLAALGALLAAHPQLSEVEINPLRQTVEGLIALDAVILTERTEP